MDRGAARALPTGTVTFLFTDVERSTETVGALGDEPYAEIQDAHRKLLRDAFAAHSGVEVGTEGDAFFVAFSRAGDAVSAAVEGQQALALGSELRVRMGIHTGEAVMRDDNYVGHDVHRAKRICDAGHGGQILLSQTTADLVRRSGVVDLGPHRLKDLEEPQHLYQVAAEGLATDFPPLRSLESFTHNLPPQRTSFVGREREIAEIRDLLRAHHLVTLTGVGGCGKTRLAIQVGAEAITEYPDGVFFADLGPVSDPTVIISTLTSALGISLGGGGGPAQAGPSEELLLGHLANREALLILDNCEHLLDACADVADRILARCRRVSLLATSREALDVEGEQSSRVPSLSVPEDARDAETSEAVTLFSQRATAVRPDFALNSRNVTAVTEICRRLDGIPLAIEFAASRVAHLSPQEIAARLNDVFRLLTGGRRRVQRQNTLEAALDWSYQLLSDTERTLLRRLSVFAGRFSIAAAESICSDESVPSQEVLDLIGSLVAKSLVTTETHEDHTRYRLIETVRQYAATKLRDADEAAVFRTRHRDYYQAWVESIGWERVLITVVDLDVVPEWSNEGANLRSALEWSDTEGRPDLVVAMASRLRQLWYYGGSIEEGLRWLTHARPEDLDISIEERVSALTVGQICALLVSDPIAGELGERAVEAGAGTVSVPYCAALSWRGISRALRSVATADADLAKAAITDGEAGLRMAEGLGHPLLVSQALSYAGDTLLILGDIEGAEDFLWRAYEIAPDRPLVGYQAAAASHLLGHHEQALKAVEHSLPDLGTPGGVSLIFASYVIVEALAWAGVGEFGAARKRLRDFLQETKGSGYFGTVEQIVLGFAAVAHLEGDSRHASKLLGWVGSRTMDVGRYMPSATSPPIYVHYVKAVREALDREEARRLRAEGRAMSEEEVIACVLTSAEL